MPRMKMLKGSLGEFEQTIGFDVAYSIVYKKIQQLPPFSKERKEQDDILYRLNAGEDILINK